MTIKHFITTIADYPKPGIMFRDVTSLFQNPKGLRKAVDEIVYQYAGTKVDKVAGIEARGFILGGAIAHQLSVGFVPIRKKGKLPRATVEMSYQLEYGEDVIEIHRDSVEAGERILLVDDLIATGGTGEAGIKLIESLGGTVVSLACVVDLPDLGGRKRIEARGIEVFTLVAFDGD